MIASIRSGLLGRLALDEQIEAAGTGSPQPEGCRGPENNEMTPALAHHGKDDLGQSSSFDAIEAV